MTSHAVNPQASALLNHQDAKVAQETDSFHGFEPLNANYVYCPNQFFDVCLKSNSRGMVRIVSYILRQTLGWLDKNGQPIHQTVKVSYSDLIERAGVSRGAIADAIQRAVAIGFIECRVAGSPKRLAQPSQTAEYTLRWDNGSEYAKSIDTFKGFFAGEGNRTPIPNAFFDQIISSETLAVAKVVGAVIRHTVGYQNQFGRRQVSPLSCTYLQNYTQLKKRQAVIDAIRHAENVGYIRKVEAGKFSPYKNEQTTSTYSIQWLGEEKTVDNGSIKLPDTHQSKKVTSIGSIKSPDDRFKKVTSIEKTNSKDIFKQQAVVADELLAIQKLVDEGFDKTTASKIVEKRGADVAIRQARWLDARKPHKNRLGMLRKAIDEDWAEPEPFRIRQKQESLRKREAAISEKKMREDEIANERKRQRNARKQLLMQEWKSASIESRTKWIAAAAKRQTATMLRDIIRRQKPETKSPHVQVLDELAFENSLPPVTSGNSPNKNPNISAVESVSNSPQRKNMVTN